MSYVDEFLNGSGSKCDLDSPIENKELEKSMEEEKKGDLENK